MDYKLIIKDLEKRLNPDGAVKPLFGGALVGYAGSEFQTRLLEGVLRTRNRIGVMYSPERADRFLQDVAQYVHSTLPTIEDSVLDSIKTPQDGESFSSAGVMSKVRVNRYLQQSGFFGSLDKVYTTLELVSALSERYSRAIAEKNNDLRSGKPEDVKNELKKEIQDKKLKLMQKMTNDQTQHEKSEELFDTWLAKQSEMGKFGYEVGRYCEAVFILANFDHSYQTMIRLLEGIDLSTLID